jgi:hypothetical protein
MNDNDTGNCCIYHAIIEALDTYSEAHSPTSVDDIIDALITVTAEFVAMHDDAKVRKFVAKREMEKLAQRAREFRAIGRYPGGPASSHPVMKH